MNRRAVIRNMAVAAAGLVALPGCDFVNRKASARADQNLLTLRQETLLGDVVDTFIPATDTPGAKDLKVHYFVRTMVADCYEPEAQVTLTEGLSLVEKQAQEKYHKGFGKCSSAARTAILQAMEHAEGSVPKDFYALVKNLTIQGYLSSAYVMTNLTHYEQIPGHYYGCVPVNPKSVS